MGVNHWNAPDGDRSWDVLILGGKVVPGIANVVMDLQAGLDVGKPKGGKGATIKDEGDPPAVVDVTVQLATQEELDAFKALVPMLRPKSKSAARDPIPIEHPNPNFWGIRNVVVGDIKAPMPTAKEGWTISIKLIEWVPVPKAVKKSSKKSEEKEAAAWAPFVDKDVREKAPSQTNAAKTNLFG
jgi:hypothetical protein